VQALQVLELVWSLRIVAVDVAMVVAEALLLEQDRSLNFFVLVVEVLVVLGQVAENSVSVDLGPEWSLHIVAAAVAMAEESASATFEREWSLHIVVVVVAMAEESASATLEREWSLRIVVVVVDSLVVAALVVAYVVSAILLHCSWSSDQICDVER
jgi:hypothetical protein